jgi:hypothetical protein
LSEIYIEARQAKKAKSEIAELTDSLLKINTHLANKRNEKAANKENISLNKADKDFFSKSEQKIKR